MFDLKGGGAAKKSAGYHHHHHHHAYADSTLGMLLNEQLAVNDPVELTRTTGTVVAPYTMLLFIIGASLSRHCSLVDARHPRVNRYEDLTVFNCSLKLPSCLSAIKIPSSITSENESCGA